MIDKERVCKVADFGFARDIVDNHVYERKSDGRLPIRQVASFLDRSFSFLKKVIVFKIICFHRWMAPEALYDNLFTTKTDGNFASLEKYIGFPSKVLKYFILICSMEFRGANVGDRDIRLHAISWLGSGRRHAQSQGRLPFRKA